ncbi:hypothetical protein JW916_15960 [Candidatus Sumerlaeota bacterium]|nr:hypothetical protein [Candidatus Sumerlaeota bacterium]
MISGDPQENDGKAPDGQKLRKALDACAKIQSDMVLGRLPGDSGRGPVSGFALVASLFLLSVLMSFGALSGLVMSGGMTALALNLWQRTTRVKGVVVMLAAAGLGFLAGDPAAGAVVASALAVAAVYRPAMRAMPGEDDHFYLIPVLMWVFLFVAVGIGIAVGGEAARIGCVEQVRRMASYLDEEGRKVLSSSLAPGEEPGGFMKWRMDQIVPLQVGTLLGVQALFSFLAVKWVRARLGWGPPLGIGLLFFRIGPRYTLLLAASLTMLIVAPDVEKANLTGIALATLMWFGSGCFLGGLACAGYAIAAFRAAGQPGLAWLCIGGLILVLAILPIGAPLLAAIGLIDIWLNIRRLPEKEA